MKNKIVSITKKTPIEITDSMLPDGLYNGIWSGSSIKVKYKDIVYELQTEGMRGFNYLVIVEIKKGKATFGEIKN